MDVLHLFLLFVAGMLAVLLISCIKHDNDLCVMCNEYIKKYSRLRAENDRLRRNQVFIVSNQPSE